MKYCPNCGHCADKEEKSLPDFEDSAPRDDFDVKASVLDELIGLMDDHAGKKLSSVKKPKAVSVEVLSVGKPKKFDAEEDDEDEEV